MGEEEKKASGEEKKVEEKKAEGSNQEEEGNESKYQPPHDIILRVYMHCEGCARKVSRSLKDFPGVEDVITDCNTSKVVVKGEKADPLKVVERIQRKSHRQVELISPLPKSSSQEEKEASDEKNPQEKKEEAQAQVITVVLKVYMHCEACAMEIKKRIKRMKGVESAEADLKSSEVTVKGVFDPSELVDYVYKRTGKHAVVVKPEPEKKEEEKNKEPQEEKKAVEEDDKEKKLDGVDQTEKKGVEGTPNEVTSEETRSDYFYHPQSYPLEMVYYAYPPQIFSDENPNACTVM